MSYKFPQFVIPDVGFQVVDAVIKPTAGRWQNMFGKFSMPMEVALYPSVKASQADDSRLKYPLSAFLTMMGEDPGAFSGNGRVDGLKPEAWNRIKTGLLELIYTEFGLEYPVFAQAEKV